MQTLEERLFDEKNNYYVATSQNLFSAPSLDNDLETDNLIIGAGLAGLSTAMGLIERQVEDVTLIDAQRVGFGASGRNGGFVFGGFSLPEERLVQQLGIEQGRWAYELTTSSVDLIRSRIDRYGIECDKSETGVLLADWFRINDSLKEKQAWLQEQLGVTWEWVDAPDVKAYANSNRYHRGLLERNAFHMHPLKYVKGVAKAFVDQGGSCYEQTPALAIEPMKEGVRVTTPQGVIKAKRCVISCGGYMGQLYPAVSRAILPISTYIMVTEPLGAERISALMPKKAAIYDSRFAFDYYRPLPDTRLLWGGRISIKARDRGALIALLRRDMAKVFPELSSRVAVDYAWGGLMGYPIHKMPMIGRTHPSVWHVTGFGGHGVAPTTAGGELMARALTGDDEGISKLERYQPQFAWGALGLLGAQMTYWGLTFMDWLKERRSSLYNITLLRG